MGFVLYDRRDFNLTSCEFEVPLSVLASLIRVYGIHLNKLLYGQGKSEI
jgi:hypothetical protein